MKKHRKNSKEISFSKTSLRDLDAIATYTQEKFSLIQAKTYIALLHARVKQIALDPMIGRTFEPRPDLRYVTAHFRSSGYGHIIVYRDSAESIEILHIFHTSQDWRHYLYPD